MTHKTTHFCLAACLVIFPVGASDALAQQKLAPDHKRTETHDQTEYGEREFPGKEDIWVEHTLPDDVAGTTVRKMIPFTRDQILKFGEAYHQTKLARAEAKGPPPKARIRTLPVKITDQQAIEEISTTKGYTTALVFTDITGAPFPVAKVLINEDFKPKNEGQQGANGNGNSNSEEEGFKEEHIVYLYPRKQHIRGNLTIELRGLDVPITMTVVEGKPVSDFRVSVRVMRPGPLADQMALVQPETFHPGDLLLSQFLAGGTPKGARRMAIDGGDFHDQAWVLDNHIYLKTNKRLMAPETISFEKANDNTWAYKMPMTPYALLSHEGARMQMHFKNERDFQQ